MSHENYLKYKAAADARKTLAARLRAAASSHTCGPETYASDAERFMNEAADAIDYLHAQIAAMRREASEEAREAQRDARESFAEGQASAREGYERGCY